MQKEGPGDAFCSVAPIRDHAPNPRAGEGRITAKSSAHCTGDLHRPSGLPRAEMRPPVSMGARLAGAVNPWP